jgi:hypothetical protein
VIRYDPRTRRAQMRRRAFLRIGLAGGAALAIAKFSPLFRHDDEGPLPPVLVVPPPAIVTRAEWGADESRRRGGVKFDNRVEKIVIHHTATSNSARDWAEQVRNIYGNEIAQGYTDLSYHFLVAPTGAIYEGRWAREYPAGHAHDGEDARGRNVLGGHAFDHNHRTIGLALIGDYSTALPPTAAIDSLVQLLVWKCARWGIDARGTSSFRDDTGDAQRLPNIVPHAQIKATECPGTNVISLLGDLRERTGAAIDLL